MSARPSVLAERRAGTRPAPCMGSVKGGEMDQRTPLAFLLSCFLAFLLSCFLAFLLSCFLAFLLSCFLAFLLSCFLAFLLSSLLPFWRFSSFAETFLHLDATFLLTLPRRQNLLVDSVLRRGQLLVEADRDIR